MSSVSTGIDSPAVVYRIAMEFFRIESGLLLILDNSNDSFYPFASSGVDKTSLRRCIISKKALTENHIILNGTSVHTDFPKDFLKPYLSRRFWDVIENLSIVILNYNDSIFGLLFLFNSKASLNESFFESASVFIKLVSENFAVSRTRLVRNLDSGNLPNISTFPEVPDLVSDYFSSDKLSKSLPVNARCVLIDYSSLINQIVKNTEFVDLFMIERDIFKVFNSMLNNLGCIIRLSDYRLFMLFLSGINNAESIFSNQISASLLSLFEKKVIINTPDVRLSDVTLAEDNLHSTIEDFINSCK